MKRGDLVASRRRTADGPVMIGIVIRVFEVAPLPNHSRALPLPMVKIATKDGAQCWKRRKVKVINEY